MKNEQKQKKQAQLEIYKKFDEFEIPEFPVSFRGYDKYEVDKYLNTLVDAYNKMYEEHREALAELNEYRRKKDAIAEAMIELKITEDTGNPESDDYYVEVIDAPANNSQFYGFSDHNNTDINDLLKDILADNGGS